MLLLFDCGKLCVAERTRRKFFLSFLDMGNRRAKHIYTDNAFTLLEKSTYYVRDASGNVMAVYDRIINETEEIGGFALSERHIYGSSRIGMDVTTYEFISTTYTATDEATRELGHKQCEISNHLGNVLSVITDQKLPVEEASVVVSYSAVIITATDYSPFGVGLYGRSWSEGYRYGFNGKEKDAEGMGGGSSTYDYGFRIYNAGLGRFLSTDPLSKEYPWYTPYQFAGNKPIWCIDIDGAEELIVTIRQDPNTPQLRKITITKVSESTRVSDPNFGTMGVQYVLQDAQGVVTSSQRMPDLQPGSAEEYAMNRTKLFYGTQGGNLNGETPTTMTQREALNPTPNGSGKGAAADCSFNESRNEKESNQLVGVVIYDFKLDIQFNTDKAGITIEDLQPGTYDLAIDDLNSLTQILQNDSRFARRTVVCIGSTDIRPSRYKAPDGRVCGNPCLAEDRANSVANFIQSEVSQIVLTTTAVSTSTEVVDSDRRTTVVLDAN